MAVIIAVIDIAMIDDDDGLRQHLGSFRKNERLPPSLCP